VVRRDGQPDWNFSFIISNKINVNLEHYTKLL